MLFAVAQGNDDDVVEALQAGQRAQPQRRDQLGIEAQRGRLVGSKGGTPFVTGQARRKQRLFGQRQFAVGAERGGRIQSLVVGQIEHPQRSFRGSHRLLEQARQQAVEIVFRRDTLADVEEMPDGALHLVHRMRQLAHFDDEGVGPHPSLKLETAD